VPGLWRPACKRPADSPTGRLNFIIDAQLPKRLATWLRAQGHDCIHTKDLRFQNRMTDSQILRIAREQDCCPVKARGSAPAPLMSLLTHAGQNSILKVNPPYSPDGASCMDIEYFPEPKILLIYGHQPKIIAHFREQIAALGEKRVVTFPVHELQGFRSIGGCQLFVSNAASDYGTRLVNKPLTFECKLRPITWDNIEGLLEPFCDGSYFAGNHQFLDSHGKIQLIISGSRGW
jgi:hypothetical protein